VSDTIKPVDVGTRLLVTTRYGGISRTEVIVREISPCGQYVKLENPDAGTVYWSDVTEYRILTVLAHTP